MNDFTKDDLAKMHNNFTQQIDGNDIIVITGATRNRLSEDDNVVSFQDEKFSSQDELAAFWQEQYEEFRDNDELLRPVSGKNGIYSKSFMKSLATNNIDIPAKNIYFIDKFHGIINSTEKAINYDAGTYTDKDGKVQNNISNMTALIDSDAKRKFNQAEWWNSVKQLTGNSMINIMELAIAENKQIHIVLTTLLCKLIKQDLLELLENFSVDIIARHLRIFSKDVDVIIPSKLMGISIYADDEILDNLVYGTVRVFHKRLWMYYLHTIEEFNSDPFIDADVINEHYMAIAESEEKFTPDNMLYWDNGSNSASGIKVAKIAISIEEAYCLIAEKYFFGAPTYGSLYRIRAILQQQNYSIDINKIQAGWDLYGKPVKGVEYTPDTLKPLTNDNTSAATPTKKAKKVVPLSKKAKKKHKKVA